MNRIAQLMTLVFIFITTLFTQTHAAKAPASANREGGVLAGILYNSTSFTNPREELDLLPSLDMSWGHNGGKFLRLQDKDPYEYAKAVRVFPEATLTNLSFKLRPHQVGTGDLEIEVLNYKGQRPVRVKLEGSTGKVQANAGGEYKNIASFKPGEWTRFDISIDMVTGVYSLKLNGQPKMSNAAFAEALTFADNPYPSRFMVATVERIEFRTGVYRMTDFSRYGSGDNGCSRAAEIFRVPIPQSKPPSSLSTILELRVFAPEAWAAGLGNLV